MALFFMAWIDGYAPFSDNRTALLVGLNASTGKGAVAVAVDPATGAILVEGGGGGTQYTDGQAVPTHPIGGAIEYNNAGTWTTVSAANPLPVTGGGGGQQYTDAAAAPAHPIGTIPVFNNAGTIEAVSAANPLPITFNALQTIGSAVPADAIYLGINAAGNILGAQSVVSANGTLGNATLGAGVLAQYNSSHISTTNTRYYPLQMDSVGNLQVNIQDAPVADTIYNGQATATGTAAAIQSSQALTQGVSIQASSANTVAVYVGNSSVTAVNGLQLPPGASVTLPINNLDLVYIICSTPSQVVTYIGV